MRVQPDQVTMHEITRSKPSVYVGQDLLLQAPAEMTLREDGNLGVIVATAPFPTEVVMIREALEDPDRLDAEFPAK